MIARRTVLGLVAVGAAALVVGCDGVEDMPFLWEPPYHARLTAEVETPEGLRSGSGVIEVKWGKSGKSYQVRGQAVPIDLPGGEVLYVLLRSEANVDWAAYLHESVDGPEIESGDRYWASIAANRAVWPVKRRRVTGIEDSDNYPYMVRFRDPADPKSVEQVDPDDLAKTFGPEYRLKSLTVQMTDDPVTSGIEKRLGWVGRHKGMLDNSGDPNRLHQEAAKNLTNRDFVRGELK